ncbi:hypothetical protein [Streptomyces roseochromogenus]|uniref:Uncharacterized protein n=1 Tax=Streptomyces roseochromogenus subsp. oscitans DS 12.976 TaxID=1352936 RepID=V6JQC4_STRRC|nr:hypothetical protein [Streptomyces roseochromogenus]EST21311.1 hypothetical protein M878_37455 [Streptomyces roseochromogenus subsp. oscitans DS 12.976]
MGRPNGKTVAGKAGAAEIVRVAPELPEPEGVDAFGMRGPATAPNIKPPSCTGRCAGSCYLMLL